MFPEFIVIGAMKAGTTTLFHDLRTHTHAYIPDKELNALTDDNVLTRSGREEYAARYARIQPGQRAGDVSTTYAMLPQIDGCAERARTVLGAETRIVYLVRDPVERILSQHHHERQYGLMTLGIDDAVRQYERYVAFSQYARQLDPWLDCFGADMIKVVRLEDYRCARTQVVRSISEFIGTAFRGEDIETAQIHNESRAKPILRGPWRSIHRSAVYRRAVRPLMSSEMRERIRGIALPRSTEKRERPSAATVAFLVERLRDDLERQRRMLGDTLTSYSPEQLLSQHVPHEESPGQSGAERMSMFDVPPIKP